MPKIKRYELKKKDFIKSSVFATAFVTQPAIEIGLVYLNAEKEPSYKLKLEKGIAYSPVLIPNQIIPRSTEDNEEFEVFFTAETIEEISQDYMLAGANVMQNWNSQHNDHQKLDGVGVVENWIVQNPETDKSTQLGFKVPAGTWMQGIKIENDAVKEKIKSGEYFGISIEGDFDHIVKLKSETNLNDSVMNKTLKQISTMLSALVPATKFGSQTLETGETIYFEGEELQEGQVVFSDEAMTIPVGKIVEGKVEMEKKKEGEEDFNAEEAAEGLGKLAEAHSEKIKSIEAKSTALEVENVQLKKLNSELETKFTALETKVNAHEVKLSKVKAGDSATKLAAEGDKKLIGINKHFNVG